MKHQALFPLKDKSKKIKCCLLKFLFGALRVKVLITVIVSCDTDFARVQEHAHILIMCRGYCQYTAGSKHCTEYCKSACSCASVKNKHCHSRQLSVNMCKHLGTYVFL